MKWTTLGDKNAPAVLFFHAMGVTGESSVPVARALSERYFCILPTATVYCPGQRYIGKQDEVRQVETFLRETGVRRLALVTASSLGADLAMAFLARTALPVEHVYFDGGQFAHIGKGTRRLMTPLLFLAIKSLYWTRGGTLKHILWCDDEGIKPYFIAAGKALTYGNLRRQLGDSLTEEPFPAMTAGMQGRTWFAFGEKEDHLKYRPAVMAAYPGAHFPVFEAMDHMEYRIREPRGFAGLLRSIVEGNALPPLPFLKEGETNNETLSH